MIGRLTGRIVEDGIDGTVVLDVAGVGYEVTVPLGTVGRVASVTTGAPVMTGSPGGAPGEAAGAVTLFVHTHVREDALLLYGFASLEDRAAFRHLISVSNIGPKIAMSILGAMSVGELSTAIARGETTRLTKVPGVGKKTAERVVLELKDKLLAPPPAHPHAAPPPKVGGSAKAELLQGALTRMGFRPAEAERAISALGAKVEEAPLGELIREALAVLR